MIEDKDKIIKQLQFEIKILQQRLELIKEFYEDEQDS